MKNYKDDLVSYFKNNKRMPTYGEMLKLFNYKSKSTVSYAVNKLIEQGIIFKDKAGKIILNEWIGGVKVLGQIEAGFPSPAEEELVDTMNLDDYLIKNKDASYILKVKGDSMIDAGIFDGDMVIVERGKKPKVGDIVIAQIDGEYTMKYYELKKGKAYLEPANKDFKAIYPKNELKVDAVVKAVIRKY